MKLSPTYLTPRQPAYNSLDAASQELVKSLSLGLAAANPKPILVVAIVSPLRSIGFGCRMQVLRSSNQYNVRIIVALILFS